MLEYNIHCHCGGSSQTMIEGARNSNPFLVFSIIIILLNIFVLCLVGFMAYVWMSIDIDIEDDIPVEETINGKKNIGYNVCQVNNAPSTSKPTKKKKPNPHKGNPGPSNQVGQVPKAPETQKDMQEPIPISLKTSITSRLRADAPEFKPTAKSVGSAPDLPRTHIQIAW